MTGEKEPVELTRKDIIPRPEGLVVKTASAPASPGTKKNPLTELKEILETVKEFKTMADDLGINIPWMPQGGKAGDPEPKESDPPAPPPGGQFIVLLQMLRIKYGDITVNQLIAALVQEYGDRKLSTLVGGKK